MIYSKSQFIPSGITMLHTVRSVCLMLACAWANAASAAVVVQWDFTGDVGDELSKASSATDANVSGIDFHRGSGLNTAPRADTFNTSGWGSQDPDDYIAFGFSVAPGFSVELTSLQIGTQGTLLSPATLGLYYSGDSFTNALHVINQPLFASLNSNIDLTGLGSLTGNVEFRLLEIGNASPDYSSLVELKRPRERLSC